MSDPTGCARPDADSLSVSLLCGRGAVVPASAGFAPRRTWSTKFEMRSPRYTTHVDELPIVSAA